MEVPNSIGEWVFLILSLLSLPVIIPFYVKHILTKKGADKALDLEEEKTDSSVYAAQTDTWQKLVKETRDAADRANASTQEALQQIESLKNERKILSLTLEEQNEKIEKLRKLFLGYVSRTGIVMTDEEYRVFEATKPKQI